MGRGEGSFDYDAWILLAWARLRTKEHCIDFKRIYHKTNYEMSKGAFGYSMFVSAPLSNVYSGGLWFVSSQPRHRHNPLLEQLSCRLDRSRLVCHRPEESTIHEKATTTDATKS